MRPVALSTFLGFAGILAELAGALILVSLFAVLRGHAARRPFFPVWGWAWAALALALTVLALRYLGLMGFTAWFDDFAIPVRAFYFVYQFAKLVFYGLLVKGALMYARGLRSDRLGRGIVLGAGVLALVTAAPALGLSQQVMLQAPFAILGFGASGILLLRLPRSRRSVGTVATALAFLALALLWLLYLFAFGFISRLGYLPPGGLRTFGRVLRTVLQFNSYADLLLHVTLGYGMVVLLLEDRKRESDDAHAVLAAVHDQLRREALYDALTGALNRRAYGEGVGLEWANATYGAVAMVDVDDLKVVNDRYGHPVGDALLRHTADALRGALRASDKLYRWGGDEFLLVLPAAKAAEVAPRLRAMLAAAAPLAVAHASERWRPEASLGAADYAGAESLESAIAQADRAMYEDKQRHREHDAHTIG